MKEAKEFDVCLIKFMKSEYVEDFINKGIIHCNNLEYFKKYELDSNVRSDKHEGLEATFNSNKVGFSFGGIKANNIIGNIHISLDRTKNIYVYCATKIISSDFDRCEKKEIYLSEKFKNFGDKAIVIYGDNINKFELLLKEAILKDKNIFFESWQKKMACNVDYVESNYHGCMGVFKKFDSYKWQYEWRLAFKQKESKEAYNIELGDLTDIVNVVDTNDLLNNPLVLTDLE